MINPIAPQHFKKSNDHMVVDFIKKVNETIADKRPKSDVDELYVETVFGGYMEKLNEYERKEAIQNFKTVGWENCTILYSDENGERGGLVQVRLYFKNPNNRPIAPKEIKSRLDLEG
jgi:hypothetical protein